MPIHSGRYVRYICERCGLKSGQVEWKGEYRPPVRCPVCSPSDPDSAGYDVSMIPLTDIRTTKSTASVHPSERAVYWERGKDGDIEIPMSRDGQAPEMREYYKKEGYEMKEASNLGELRDLSKRVSSIKGIAREAEPLNYDRRKSGEAPK